MGTGYRPPSAEPRGRWARHIHAKRREWGWSQTRGFEAVREGLGLSEKSRAAYITLDMGPREPNEVEAAALAAVYGYPPEATTTGLEATESGDSLAQAINALVVELRAMREERELVEARLRALEAERRHAQPEDAALPERSAPRG